MKKKTTIITVILSLIIAITASAAGIRSINWYKKYIKRHKIAKIREYWNEDISYEMLANRGDDIIIEKILGTVVNKKKDGRVLNPVDPDYDYISYKSVKGAKKGDVVLTVCIYQPNNSYEDDVVARFDYIIDHPKKKKGE